MELLDRLCARGHAKLAVDRGRLALDRVFGDEEPLTDLEEIQVGGQQREQPQLGGGERRHPWCPSRRCRVRRADPRPGRAGPRGRVAAGGCRGLGAGPSWPRRRRPGPAELQQRLDGEGRDGVGEQRPKASVEVADKSRKHPNPHRHQRRWEEAFRILEPLASPISGDDIASAWRRPFGWTSRLMAMEQVDA